MNTTTLIAVLAAIATIAAARAAWHARRRGAVPWRIAVLVAGQAVLAALLYFVLVPPSRPGGDGTLVVLTADAPRPPSGTGADIVALPEAPSFAGVARTPDLATALRARPMARTLRVLGAGLPARDRDVVAARGLRVVFDPAPAPAGVDTLSAPARVAAGRRFVVSGHVAGGTGARMELLDPAGHRVDLQPLASDGRFALSSTAGPAGRAEWTLQRRDAADGVAETIALPVEVVAGAPLRVLVLAGGANPEHKYLARWALDAGLSVQSRVAVGGGVDIGGALPPLTAAGLREVDLVILDDRTWRGLGDGGRAALHEAVREGVGVLLRLTGDPGEADRAALKAWGFDVAASDTTREVELPGTAAADVVATTPTTTDEAAIDATADARAPVALSRRALSLTAVDGAPLVTAVDGDVVAVWRPEGRGRVAVWNLADTFRLQLAGRRAAYGSLWAEATGRLARARDDGATSAPADARVGERVVLCGLGAAATLQPPHGDAVPLRVDPATGAAACAAAWPRQAGWHELQDGERPVAFVVRGRDEARGLARAATRAATLALAARAVDTRAAAPSPDVPGPRWPWLLAFLAAAAALWTLERSRAGRR